MHGAYDHPSATLDTSSQPACLRIAGDWTLAHYASLKRESERLRSQYGDDTIADLSQLGRLDTAGASLLAELLGSERLSHCTHDLPEASRALLKNVYCSVQDYCIPVKEAERPVLLLLLERIGCAVATLWEDTRQLLGFIGLILETLARRAWQPHRWRVTPVVAHIEQTGLDAAPIVALLTFWWARWWRFSAPRYWRISALRCSPWTGSVFLPAGVRRAADRHSHGRTHCQRLYRTDRLDESQ